MGTVNKWLILVCLALILVVGSSGDIVVSQPFPVTAVQNGTWTIQPGNTPNTSAWLVDTVPTTAAVDAVTATVKNAITTSSNVKASAGNVYGVMASNGAAAVCWVQLINSSGAGTLGTGVVFSVPLPSSGVVSIPPGVFGMSNFSSGIAVGIASSTNSSTACGTAGNVVVFYR